MWGASARGIGIERKRIREGRCGGDASESTAKRVADPHAVINEGRRVAEGAFGRPRRRVIRREGEGFVPGRCGRVRKSRRSRSRRGGAGGGERRGVICPGGNVF